MAALARRMDRAVRGRPGDRRGCWPSPAPRRVHRPRRCPPAVLPLDGPALGVLGGVAAADGARVRLARFLAARPDRALARPELPGPGVAVALVVSVAALLLWLANPYAGLLVGARGAPLDAGRAHRARAAAEVPRAAAGARRARRRSWSSTYYLFALYIDPLSGAWYLLLLVTGHSVGLATALIGCVMLGALGAAAELVSRSPAPGRGGGGRSARRSSARARTRAPDGSSGEGYG